MAANLVDLFIFGRRQNSEEEFALTAGFTDRKIKHLAKDISRHWYEGRRVSLSTVCSVIVQFTNHVSFYFPIIY